MGTELPPRREQVAAGLWTSCSSRAMRALGPGFPRPGGSVASSGAGGEAGASPSSPGRHPWPPAPGPRASLFFGPALRRASSRLEAGGDGRGWGSRSTARRQRWVAAASPTGSPGLGFAARWRSLVSPGPPGVERLREGLALASGLRSPDPLDEGRRGWGWSCPPSAPSGWRRGRGRPALRGRSALGPGRVPLEAGIDELAQHKP